MVALKSCLKTTFPCLPYIRVEHVTQFWPRSRSCCSRVQERQIQEVCTLFASDPPNFSCLWKRNTIAVAKWSPPKPEDENHTFGMAEKKSRKSWTLKNLLSPCWLELSHTGFLLCERKIYPFLF